MKQDEKPELTPDFLESSEFDDWFDSISLLPRFGSERAQCYTRFQSYLRAEIAKLIENETIKWQQMVEKHLQSLKPVEGEDK